jgi:hypothetical protein
MQLSFHSKLLFAIYQRHETTRRSLTALKRPAIASYSFVNSLSFLKNFFLDNRMSSMLRVYARYVYDTPGIRKTTSKLF